MWSVDSSARISIRLSLSALTVLGAAAMAFTLFAQTTISTGSIHGTVTDPTAAIIRGAKITIKNTDNGRINELTTTSVGTYASGALIPGNYLVRAESNGFASVEMPVVVQVGVTSSGNIRLKLGQEPQVVEVQASELRVNTEQATIQGVLTTQQIEKLPINGGNFLDLAQLEPGVQIQDASNFDPTKGGFTGISLGGRSGRTTRIELDGLDISDETVGTTLTNVSSSSIQEFGISQSALDLSTELTSSGAVNVVARSGTNTAHGEAFYFFRDRTLAASFPGGQDSPYQRHDFGGNFGAPVVRDKLFLFLNAERYKQDLGVPVPLGEPFQALSGVVQQPLREKIVLARLDWNAPKGLRLFFRFTYDNNSVISNPLLNYSIFSNLNNTPAHAVGADFNTGRYTHSIRFGYVKFQNHIADATQNGDVFNPIPAVGILIGPFQSGPSPAAPQATLQSNRQIRYDGSRSFGSHIIQYGFGFNRIVDGGFANFFGIGPLIGSTLNPTNQALADNAPFSGGRGNPLNYPVAGPLALELGNGEGFFTEIPEFGYPAGGQFDNRLEWYLGDTWKIRPYFTLSYGLHYVRDSGRTNSDMPPIPCSAIDAAVFNPRPKCQGRLLDMFGPGLGARVRQDSNNFAPQMGIAWDLFRDGKTVFRAGAGLFYENALFNDVLFSRPVMLQKGLFNFIADQRSGQGCSSGSFVFPGGRIVTTTPGGLDIATQICGQPIGLVAGEVAALQREYQAANLAAGAALNPQFIGETLNQSNALLAPNYRSAYSFQMNVGIQGEIRKGTIISADYLRNVNLRYLLGVDTNHVGDTRYLNKTAAANAISTTLAACGVNSMDQGIQGCPNNIDANGRPTPLSMEDLAANGVTSAALLFAGPSSIAGLDPDHGAAFAGVNPQVGQNIMLFPIGRSVYNALQVVLKHQADHPLPLTKSVNLQFSYSLSRFVTAVGSGIARQTNDQDFINQATDFRRPLANLGPGSFDRTHQFSLGGIFDFPRTLSIGLIAHVYSPLSQSLFVEDGGRAGEIFHTDFTGDGTTGDILPGTRVGSFGREIKSRDLTSVLNKYNATAAGNPTPAGEALVHGGLFTRDQLFALGATADAVPLGPASNRAALGWLKTVDLRTSFSIKRGEKLVIEPSVAIYNLFNFVNYDVSPRTRPQAVLNGAVGSINGTRNSIEDRNPERAYQSSSTFSLGSARQVELGVRIVF